MPSAYRPPCILKTAVKLYPILDAAINEAGGLSPRISVLDPAAEIYKVSKASLKVSNSIDTINTNE